MENEIQKINNTLDSLMIETALNTAHLKTLTIDYLQLAKTVLTDDQYKEARDYHYHTLLEQSGEILHRHDDADYLNPAKATMALFDLQCYVKACLKNL